MRLFDGMQYFAVEGMVQADNLPPAGVHLNDHGVGALLALWKGGGTTVEELARRWPSTFEASGKVYKALRPMGDPFLMRRQGGRLVFGQASGSTLLCGAGYKQKEWEELATSLTKNTANNSFWLTKSSKGRYLVPSDVSAVPGSWDNTTGYLAILNEKSARAVNEDSRAIYPDASELPKAINIEWPTPKGLRPGITFLSPKKVKSSATKLDDGDAKADWPAAGRADVFGGACRPDLQKSPVA